MVTCTNEEGEDEEDVRDKKDVAMIVGLLKVTSLPCSSSVTCGVTARRLESSSRVITVISAVCRISTGAVMINLTTCGVDKSLTHVPVVVLGSVWVKYA